MSRNATIAKNTIYLYVRMLVTMLLALYTSRVILQKLGVDDYGIYQAVGGIVGLLAFINSAIATGTSRFLSFELGAGNLDRLRRTFASSLTVHLLIAVLVWVVAETLGVWFVQHKLMLAADRFSAALITYHVSILTVVLNLVLVPFSASVIAHERMNAYALITIFEAVAKLGVCYLISQCGIDRLVAYALLLCGVQVAVFLLYSFYCCRRFEECGYRLSLDMKILMPILTFSGWSLFANGSFALANYGILVLLNMFFSPAVVAARAISLQVINAAGQLVNNYRLAVNPPVVKLYAAGDVAESRRLLLLSTRFSFFLMLLVAVPLYFLIDPILDLWLDDNIPVYTSVFIRIGVLQSLFQVFDASFYTALYAQGRIRINAMISPTIIFLVFPVVYLLFRMGYSPVVLSWAYLLAFALLGLVVKPVLLIRICGYSAREICSVFLPCLTVSLLTAGFAFLLDSLLAPDSWVGYCVELVLLVGMVGAVSFFVGLDRGMRQMIYAFVKERLS